MVVTSGFEVTRREIKNKKKKRRQRNIKIKADYNELQEKKPRKHTNWK